MCVCVRFVSVCHNLRQPLKKNPHQQLFFNRLQDVKSILTQFVVCTRRMQFESLGLWNQSGSGIQHPFYRICISQACACHDVLVPIVFLVLPGVCLSSAWIYFHYVFVVSDAWQASLLFSGRHLHLSAISHTTVATKFPRCFCSIFEFPTITLCRLTRKWLQNYYYIWIYIFNFLHCGDKILFILICESNDTPSACLIWTRKNNASQSPPVCNQCGLSMVGSVALFGHTV